MAYRQFRVRESQFYDLIDSTRQRLLYCYDGRNDFSLDERQHCKDDAFAKMTRDYAAARQQGNIPSAYDRWFEKGLNNARFISSYTYRYYIPAFAELLRREQGDLQDFYAAAKRLAVLPSGERRLALSSLREASIAANSGTSAASGNAVR